MGNKLVRFSIRVWTAVCLHPLTPDGFRVFLLGEHPEDLGGVIRQEDRLFMEPASIWQIQAIRDLVGKPGTTLGTVAISQWGAPYRKPTRLLANCDEVLAWGPNEWPQMDDNGFYKGPCYLNLTCSCIQ